MDQVPQERPRPWLDRTEQAFNRVAPLLMDSCSKRTQEHYALCCAPEAESARREVLATPSVAFALLDLQVWFGGVFAKSSPSAATAPWRQIMTLPQAVERISRITELVALAVQGEGTVTIERSPCSLPGLDVCITEPNRQSVALKRCEAGWQPETGRASELESVRLYGVVIRIDGDAPWITEAPLMTMRGGETPLRHVSTSQWSWRSAPSAAAALIERGLGEEGRILASYVHTLIPVDHPGKPIVGWVNRVVPGAVYVKALPRPLMLAELIVHETTHIWLAEEERIHPTIESEREDALLPFGSKQLPASTVLQEVVAHSWARKFWRTLRDSETGMHSFVAKMRYDQVEKTLRDGLESLEKAANILSPFGREVMERARTS